MILNLCPVGSENGQILFLVERRSKVIVQEEGLWGSLTGHNRYNDGRKTSTDESIKDSNSEREVERERGIGNGFNGNYQTSTVTFEKDWM